MFLVYLVLSSMHFIVMKLWFRTVLYKEIAPPSSGASRELSQGGQRNSWGGSLMLHPKSPISLVVCLTEEKVQGERS